MRKGYIHIYTGNSKGKTTAALGLALRAMGAGLRVFVGQFIKKRICSEHKALERFRDLITVRQYGTGFIMGKKPASSAIAAAKKGFADVKKALSSGQYDMVILDEINIAVHYGLLSTNDVLKLFEKKPPAVELIITGRYADKKLIKKADLVTEMREIKHYFKQGVKARKGIEY
ncbi:MAG: cob(I)yrinic acid a,c-diamide adenosyltransferase [Nitrospirae bacterium]|nr:MAG: cob(I)yrinic acid a,c-diamide adenosyltransferase [Nitrospirota bacterium]